MLLFSGIDWKPLEDLPVKKMGVGGRVGGNGGGRIWLSVDFRTKEEAADFWVID